MLLWSTQRTRHFKCIGILNKSTLSVRNTYFVSEHFKHKIRNNIIDIIILLCAYENKNDFERCRFLLRLPTRNDNAKISVSWRTYII